MRAPFRSPTSCSTARIAGYAVRACLAALLMIGAVATARAQESVQARMDGWSKALGVECSHCHIDDQWSLPYMPTFDLAFRMSKMVDSLNEGPLKSMGGVTCNTCHRGDVTPRQITRDQWEAAARPHEAAFNGDNSLALQMGVFTASLGVQCTFCHDGENWGSDDNPLKGVGRRMRGMVGGINKHFAGVKNPEISCMSCHQGKSKPE